MPRFSPSSRSMAAEVVELPSPRPRRGCCSTPPSAAPATPGAVLEAHPHLTRGRPRPGPAAVAAARSALAAFGARARGLRARFDRIAEVLDGLGDRPAVGRPVRPRRQLPQLDRAERGFSFRPTRPARHADGSRRPGPPPPTSSTTCRRPTLAALFAANGEGRFARRIARAIVAARPLHDHRRAGRSGARRHPGRRPADRRPSGPPGVPGASASPSTTSSTSCPAPSTRPSTGWRPGGRCVVISLPLGRGPHRQGAVPRRRHRRLHLPARSPCVCGAVPTVRLLDPGALRPSPQEVESNRRAESARLRAARAPASPSVTCRKPDMNQLIAAGTATLPVPPRPATTRSGPARPAAARTDSGRPARRVRPDSPVLRRAARRRRGAAAAARLVGAAAASGPPRRVTARTSALGRVAPPPQGRPAPHPHAGATPPPGPGSASRGSRSGGGGGVRPGLSACAPGPAPVRLGSPHDQGAGRPRPPISACAYRWPSWGLPSTSSPRPRGSSACASPHP